MKLLTTSNRPLPIGFNKPTIIKLNKRTFRTDKLIRNKNFLRANILTGRKGGNPPTEGPTRIKYTLETDQL